jgi:hypothetical protein
MEIFWTHAHLGVVRSASGCSKFICGKGAAGKKRIEGKRRGTLMDVAVRRKTFICRESNPGLPAWDQLTTLSKLCIVVYEVL